MKMREQSVECGTEILTKTVDNIDLSQRPFINYGKNTIKAHTVIIATGATAKRLHILVKKCISRYFSMCCL